MGKSSLFVAGVIVCLLLADVTGEETRRPFQSSKAPKETIVNYEVVVPCITYEDSKRAHPRVLHINIPTQRTNYSLMLELNEQLLSKSFTSRYYDENGQEAVTKGHPNCFYQGWVEGHPDWRVTMSTCHGLQGSFGDLKDENSYFHLEPLNKLAGSVEQSHAFYLDSEYKHKQGSCGSKHSHVSKEGSDWSNVQEVQHYSHGRLRRQSTTRTRIVEWVIVSDHEQFIANGRSESATVMRALEVTNMVDEFYRRLNVRVVLTEAITWTNDNQISVSSDPSTLLNQFKGYRRRILTRHDSTMLLTGIDLDSSTVGIAFTRAMCSDTLSVGVTQDGGRSLSLTASTAAHELGHLLNMGHDDPERRCSCGDGGNQSCIMAAQAVPGSPPTKWSSCSEKDLNIGFSVFNLDRCLFNQPTTTVGDPVCGNGIREGDEVCDCGSAQECTDPCCNPATCQLASGAQCSAAGSCCTSSCQFVSYGTQCRAATGDCDIADYCPGDSGVCPVDEIKLDGTACDSGNGYCYSGRCPTHNAQCQSTFGSNKAVNTCYDQLNTLGNVSGNCGQNSTAFLPCSERDVQCGQLQCMSGDFLGGVGVSVVNTTTSLPSEICRSFTTLPGSNVDTLSPGLVEEGTKCGTGQVCLSQHCVSVSQITSLSCGTASNGLVCAENGVCNNHGECSCNIGFSGIHCETSSSGQDDSGAALLAVTAGIIGAILFLLSMSTVVIFFITLSMRSHHHGKSSGFKAHYSVTYHTPSAKQKSQVEVDISDDALSSYETLYIEEETTAEIKINMSKETFCDETRDEEKTSEEAPALQAAEDESSKPTSDSVDELVPVRLAPQKPPGRKPPPVPKRGVSSQGQSATIDQDQDSPEPSQSKTLSADDKSATLVHPDDQVGAQKLLTAEPPSYATEQPSLKTSREVSQPAPGPVEASKEDTSTQAQKQLPLSDSNEPIKKADVPKPQRRPAPVAPPKAEKPSAPVNHDVPVKPQPALKPVPALKPTPAPKPGGVAVSTSDSASVPAPKPKPKPVVPAQKPAAKPDREVPPKPAIKPADLNSKPKTAPKPSAAKAGKPTVATAPKPPSLATPPDTSVTTATKPSIATSTKPPVAPRSTAIPKPQFDVSAGRPQITELQQDSTTTNKPVPLPRK